VKIADIDRFFESLGRQIDRPLTILLTGGAAGILQGMNRATLDINFEVRLKSRTGWETVQKGIENASRATGITAQYSEDIDKWSLISLPARRSELYRRFGKVQVRILTPELWSIGKLTRYLSTDIHDLRVVLKKTKVNSKTAVKLWGTALGISSPSSVQTTYRKQVENFIDEYAREIWGRTADPVELKDLFLKAAQGARRRAARR
jgi:hypothetical protein